MTASIDVLVPSSIVPSGVRGLDQTSSVSGELFSTTFSAAQQSLADTSSVLPISVDLQTSKVSAVSSDRVAQSVVDTDTDAGSEVSAWLGMLGFEGVGLLVDGVGQSLPRDGDSLPSDKSADESSTMSPASQPDPSVLSPEAMTLLINSGFTVPVNNSAITLGNTQVAVSQLAGQNSQPSLGGVPESSTQANGGAPTNQPQSLTQGSSVVGSDNNFQSELQSVPSGPQLSSQGSDNSSLTSVQLSSL